MNTQTIGDRVQYLRLYGDSKHLDMSQREMQAITGVSRASISYVETGRFEPSVKQIKRLATHFNVTADWIIFGEDRKGRSQEEILQDAKNVLSEPKKSIIEKLIRLDDVKVSLVGKMLEPLMDIANTK